jgi:hypothetical protein
MLLFNGMFQSLIQVPYIAISLNIKMLLLILLLLLLLLLSSSLVTGIFFLELLLSQRWPPPLRLQVSHCSTFHIMCDVSSIAVFRSESIECLHGITSRFFLQLFVTIPVASIITGVKHKFQVPHSLYLYTQTLVF